MKNYFLLVFLLNSIVLKKILSFKKFKILIGYKKKHNGFKLEH
jgi:hypothetical protein